MIAYKKAEMTDAENLLRVQMRAFNDETRRFGPGRDGGPPGYDSLDFVKGMIQSSYFYHKILLDGTIIGGFNVKKVADGQYKLDLFFIDPLFHNQGIGTKTLAFINTCFADAKKWFVETPGYSVRNHHVYEKAGYKKVGESEREPDGFYLIYYERNV